MRWFEVVMGHSKSVEITPFNSWLTSSHYPSILCFYLAPFLKYSEILVENLWSEPTPPLFGVPIKGDSVWISPRSEIWNVWDRRNLESVGYRRSCLRDSMLSRLGTVPACDRQTDRTTDIRTARRTQDDSIYRASIASCGKKNLKLNACYGRRRRAQC